MLIVSTCVPVTTGGKARVRAIGIFMLIRESADGLYIEFSRKLGPDKFVWDYEIPKQDVLTRRGLIRWIHHLSEKNWITTEHINELIRLSNSFVPSGYDRPKHT